jgi:hypothetical protein
MLSDFDTWCKQQFEWKNYYYRQSGPGSMVVPFAARAFEAARNADTALIRQLVDALDGSIAITMVKIDLRNAALTAARARLEDAK